MTFSDVVSLSKLLFTLTIVYLQTCSGLQNITAHPGQNITAHPGQNITLRCQAPSNKIHIAVEWTRPDLIPDLVFFFMDGYTKEKKQHPSFSGRVALLDQQMKEGNLSLMLYNVTANDSGTYECRVQVNDGRRRIRGVVESPPIDTIRLMVTPQSGDTDESKGGGDKDGHVGLTVGQSVALSLSVLVAAIVVIVVIRCTKKNSYQLPPEQRGETQVTNV